MKADWQDYFIFGTTAVAVITWTVGVKQGEKHDIPRT
jgi:hypothetical protein